MCCYAVVLCQRSLSFWMSSWSLALTSSSSAFCSALHLNSFSSICSSLTTAEFCFCFSPYSCGFRLQFNKRIFILIPLLSFIYFARFKDVYYFLSNRRKEKKNRLIVFSIIKKAKCVLSSYNHMLLIDKTPKISNNECDYL